MCGLPSAPRARETPASRACYITRRKHPRNPLFSGEFRQFRSAVKGGVWHARRAEARGGRRRASGGGRSAANHPELRRVHPARRAVPRAARSEHRRKDPGRGAL